MNKMDKIKQTKETVNQGLKEMRKFKESQSQKILPLQKAGNKMYEAYVLLLELIIKKKIILPEEVEIETYKLNDSSLIKLFKQVRYLHTFFYEGQGGKAIKEDINESAKIIKRMIKKYLKN